MKHWLIAGLACALSLPVHAADLPSRAAPPVFVPPALNDDWSGCYVGGFGAFDIAHLTNTQDDTRTASSRSRTSAVAVVGPVPAGPLRTRTTTTTTNTTTVTTVRQQSSFPYGRTFYGGDGGGRLGCNYQTGRFVVGGQIEGGYLGVNGTAVNPFRTTSVSSLTGGPYGALSVRLGYAIIERTLLFVRGGVGYADIKYSTLDPRLGYAASVRGSQAMPLVGAGIEYKLTPQISLTGEYTYLRPGCRSVPYASPTSTVVVGGAPVDVNGNGSTRSCVDKHMIAFGLNYYFSPIVAPVVARY